MPDMSTDSATPLHDVVIVGSGPAGYTAAVYTARAGLKPQVVAGSISQGGALMTTTEVENFPGFPEGVMGPDLMVKMREQAEKFGAVVHDVDATALDLTGDVKVVTTEDGVLHARTVILATGSEYRKMGLDSEERLSGRGVSYCATCDGFFFRDKDIAVIGGGDSAMEEATFLTRFAKSVTVVHRRDALRASKAMEERAKSDPKIDFAWNSTVEDILGKDKVESVVLKCTEDGTTKEIPVEGIFVAIGHEPRTELVKGQVDLDGAGYIKVAEPSTATNLDGVFACGDAVDHTYRQAITAAGSGCRAALDSERWLAAHMEAEVIVSDDSPALDVPQA